MSSAGKNILLSYRDGVRVIKINRPEKKNAINTDMYKTIMKTLNEDANDDKIVVTIITGVGDYFSSGNDTKSALSEAPADAADDFFKEKTIVVKNLVEAFINYPKLLIAVVNGPAIGIATTTAALCDIVYASDTATFDAPFVKLGLCMEGASSFTLPLTLGRSKASEVLYLNHKLTAQEAFQYGLVSRVIPHARLNDFIDSLYEYGELPVNTVKVNKALLMENFKNILCECNNREMTQLLECINSEDFSNAIVKMMSRKSKL